jgi:hypothetical protein
MRWCVALILGVVLCVLPATQLLGYESAFITTLIVVLTTPWTAHLTYKQRIVLLCTPLVLLLLNALRVQNCNLPGGIRWYVLLVVPQTTLAHALFLRLQKRRRRVLFGFIVLLSLGRDLYGVYNGPSIRVFDPLLGFYAGQFVRRIVAHPYCFVRCASACTLSGGRTHRASPTLDTGSHGNGSVEPLCALRVTRFRGW